MTQPRTAEEVFSRIADEESRKFGAEDIFESIAWVEGELKKSQELYPFMREKTADEYYDYHVLRLQNQYLAKFAGPTPTSEEFWNAAYDFDPMDSSPSKCPSKLQEILRTGRMGPITLGKVYGQVTLKLLPAMGALPENPNPPYDSQLDFAGTDSGAISYPDGHPSGLMADPIEPGPSAASLSKIKKMVTIKPSNDDKLRRFTSLGFILQEEGGIWRKTGHVLVIDMDDRSMRHREPWLVLASEWPADGGETQKRDYTCRARETVLRPDRDAAGVLPGDKNRTPICKIRPMDESKNDLPVLKQFGEGFKFKPVRYGGHRKARPSSYGPDLAKVMPWYWDPKEEQEVCFTTEAVSSASLPSTVIQAILPSHAFTITVLCNDIQLSFMPMEALRSQLSLDKKQSRAVASHEIRILRKFAAYPSDIRVGLFCFGVMPLTWIDLTDVQLFLGLEYMRYDRKDKTYSFPDLHKMSFAGEQGFEGKLEGRATLEVPRSKYLATDSVNDVPRVGQRRYLSTVEGF